MMPSLIIKLRPSTPWRIGTDSGARDRVDSIFHSDSVFSAVTHAAKQLGWLDEWLAAATGEAGPQVRFSSCYPFSGETLLIVPPRNIWPPAPSVRVRWKSARFVPLSLVASLLKDPETRLREDDGWLVDSDSECLLPARGHRAKPPFHVSYRRSAPVDRFHGGAGDAQVTACLEFTDGCGMWLAVAFSSAEARETWTPRLKSCFRLLADAGFGGERSRGWGRADEPSFLESAFPVIAAALPEVPAEQPESGEPATPVEIAYWLLSLYAPTAADSIDWQRGAYSLVTRGGRIESDQRQGDLKRSTRMVAEGSVLLAPKMPSGCAVNVAPEDFPHPVLRSGHAVGIPILWRVMA